MSKDPFAEQVERAYTLLLSGKVARAFDLTREDPRLRDRYGRHMYGQSLLLARRLVGAGVPVVQVNMGRVQTWDTHSANFKSLKDRLLPPTDQGVAALLDDLEARGMLDETLVVVTGEFGRTPRIGASTGNTNTRDGRDHWAAVFSAAFAGGGVRGGQTIGQSDKMGAYPASRPYTPADLAATIYRALGVDPATELRDRLNRPIRLCTGEEIAPLFTGLKIAGAALEPTRQEESTMSIVQKMRAQLAEAMKARDTVRLGFLRYWIAQLTLGTGAEMSEADAIKKMRGVLKEAKSGLTTFTPEELALLTRVGARRSDRRAGRGSTCARRRPDQGRTQGGDGHGHRHEDAGRPAGGKRRRQGGDRRDSSLKWICTGFEDCAMAPKSVYRRVLGDRFDALPECSSDSTTSPERAMPGAHFASREDRVPCAIWSRRFWACPRQANAYPCTSKSSSKQTARSGSATFRAKP